MNESLYLARVKRIGVALALIAYPVVAGIAFAAHPNLLSLSVRHTIQDRIAEFHNNQVLHVAHALMLLAVPLLIIIALHFMNVLRTRQAWWGFVGGVLAIAGALILAIDKGALCLVPSAFDTLSEAEFRQLTPGIEAMFQYRGWLWLLWLLPLLPLGFIIQSIGLVRAQVMPRWQSIAILLGAILMANPDIDLIGLVATLFLAAGFVPYALQLLRTDDPSAQPAALAVRGIGS